MSEPSPTAVNLSPDGMIPAAGPDFSEAASTKPTQRISALDDFGRFNEMVTNPEYQLLESTLESAAEQTLNVIMRMPIETLGEFLQREQLFGEWRALRRLKAEREDRQEDLKERKDAETNN